MKKDSILQNKIVMILLVVICCLLWASAIPMIKISYQLIDIKGPFAKILFAGLRFTIAGLMVLIAAKLIFKKKLVSQRNNWSFILLIAFVQTFLTYAAYYIGLGNIAASKASIDITANIFIVVILSHFFLENDRLNYKKIIGLALGFLGVLSVNINTLDGINWGFVPSGDGLIILSGLFISIALIMIKKKSGDIDIITLNGWQLLIGGLLLSVVGYIGNPELPILTIKAFGILLYISMVSAVAFTVWFSLLRYHKASVLSMFKFVIPIFATALSVVLLKEEVFRFEIIIALILVSLGVIIVNVKKNSI